MTMLNRVTVLALIALLAPSAVSAEGARSTSQNNLKQLGLAVHGECANNLKQLGLGASAAAAECRALKRRQSGARTAARTDVQRLQRLRTKVSARCARIEYAYQCTSGSTISLKRVPCRAGSTEASCCKAARNGVNSRICGPLWQKLKAKNITYSAGIWLCKCIEEPRRRLKIERAPSGAIRRR